jgi:hypothetical protein
MHVFSWLALIFFTLAGYSTGVVLGYWIRTNKQSSTPSPSFLDTVMVFVLWIGGIASRLLGVSAGTAVCIWLLVAIFVAFLLQQVQKQVGEGKQLTQ